MSSTESLEATDTKTPATSKAMIWLILGIVVFGCVVDQITKALAVAYLSDGHTVEVVSDIFRLQLHRNPGAAFSTGTSLTIVFSTLAIIVLLVVSWLVIPKVGCKSWAIAIGMATAGVAGNLIDRLTRYPGPMKGHVIDFLALKHFAVFNIADMMLTAAAIMIAFLAIMKRVNLDGTVVSDHRKLGDRSQ